jgi:6-phosphogluconolactonase
MSTLPTRARIALPLLLLAASLGGPITARSQGRNRPPLRPRMQPYFVYVGTYTQGTESQGIYRLEMDTEGKLKLLGATSGTKNPSFLAVAPDGQHLFAVEELEDYRGEKAGAVASLRIEPRSGGAPCHIVTDALGTHVLVANYTGGSVAVLPVGRDGRLGVATSFIQHRGSVADPQRQGGPHGHAIILDAANRYALAADLGLDKVLVYKYDPTRGLLEPNDPPAGVVPPASGPRHLALHPNGRLLYAINEIKSTVTGFRFDPGTGKLAPIQTLSTLPRDFTGGNSTAELVMHPSGQFLYGSNRGHNSIAIFRVDEASGRLTPAGHQPTGGKTPRSFALDPTGSFLVAANQDTDNLTVFRVDPATGQLRSTGQSITVPKPVCVVFLQKER